ncbi:MAG: TauD/TfdA family dioxygenase [Hyphomicrobiaceae bacterium]|nr:TauD/TfdA family dioxygenase [Hyphomicrobiaceae bacterium]
MANRAEHCGGDTNSEPSLRPLTPNVGVEISGIDLARLYGDELVFIMNALNTHGALLFRNQRLSDENLVAFSRNFGDLDGAPVNENGKTAVPGLPELYVISNIEGSDGKPVGSLGSGEAAWHTDMSYLENPPDASVLYALEVPAVGGDTWVASMYAALDHMPANLRKRIEGRAIKHDGTYNSGGYVRQGLVANDDPLTSTGALHSAICAHPRTGRPVLYLGRRRNAYVEGLSLEESDALLDEMWAHATRPEFCYAHKWRVGDLLMWDNRATLHRRDEFDATERRLMHRTQIRGESAPRAL